MNEDNHESKKKSKKKAIFAVVAIVVIASFAIYTVNYNINAANFDSTNTIGEQQPQINGGNTQNVNLMEGSGTMFREELELNGEWTKTVYLEEGQYLRMDMSFDNPVKVEFFTPLQTGGYTEEFTQKGWVRNGMTGSYTLRVIPKTHASGTIMLTEIGRE